MKWQYREALHDLAWQHGMAAGLWVCLFLEATDFNRWLSLLGHAPMLLLAALNAHSAVKRGRRAKAIR